MIGMARLECGEPAAEAGELIRRQLGNSFGDFFNLHVAQYSTAETWLSDRKLLSPKKMPRTSLTASRRSDPGTPLRSQAGQRRGAPLMWLRNK